MRINKYLFLGVILLAFLFFFNTPKSYAQEYDCKEVHADFWRPSVSCSARSAWCPRYDTCTNLGRTGDGVRCCKLTPPTSTPRPVLPTATPRPIPTNTPRCEIVDIDTQGRCISCNQMRVPQKATCTGNITGYVDKPSANCGASDACYTGYTPSVSTAPPAATEAPAPTATPRPGAPTAAPRAPGQTGSQGNQNPAAPRVAVDTTCEGTLDMIVHDSTCEYKSSWKMSTPEGGGKCEVWLRSAISGELTQMVDSEGAPITNCNAEAESSDFKLNSGEDFNLVVSNGKAECTNAIVATKKCEATASQDATGGEEPLPEAPAPVVGPAIDDNKCTELGFALDGEEYGQCGGAIHDTCDEEPDGKADENTELVVKRYKNEDGELRYLTQNRGKTPGVCGNPIPTPRPTRSPTSGGNGGKPGSGSSGNAACKIGSQSPSVNDACAQCIGMAQHVKPMDPDKFNVCSDTQVINYWCNGGVSEGAKNDCAEAKQKKCAAQCAGPTATTALRQPTNTPAPGVPTATPGEEEAGLPADIAALDRAEPFGCIGTPDLRAAAAAVVENAITRSDQNRLTNFYRSSSQALRKFLCSEIKQNP